MTVRQHRVTATVNLALRAKGNPEAAIVAMVTPGTIVHVTGAANALGFVPGYVFGWLDADGQTLLADSLSRRPHFNAVLWLPQRFQPTGAPDEYDRTPGEIAGWLAVKFLEPIE